MADRGHDMFSHDQNSETMYQEASKFQPKSQSFFSSVFRAKRLRRRTEIILVAVTAVVIALVTFFAVTYGTHSNTSTSPQGNTVSLSYGQYQGTSLPSGVTQYLGLRYAAPAQRFSAPQSPVAFSGVHIADTLLPGCRGSGTFTTDSEDCLYADVYAPSNASPTSKLPVYVFIQGGGLTNANIHTNGTGLVQAANKSIITVSFSYRAGVFGFLASKELQTGGALNIGYLDQHQLLLWVQKEIAQFGGDPGHVVLGGQSAGAGSVVGQMTAYGGTNQGLFHGTIMESSSMPAVRNVSDQQFQYDNLVNRTSCAGESDTLACLRSLAGQDILDASKSAPYPGAGGSPVFQWAPVIDGNFVRDLPMSAIRKGNFVHVPTIYGDDTNEGTIFTPKSISDETQARTFIKNNWPSVTSTQLDNYTLTYDFDDTSLGQQFWEQAALAYGETRYVCPGITMSNEVAAASNMTGKVWNWRYNLATASQMQSGNGVSHGSEIEAIFGPPPGGSGQQYELLTSQDGTNNVVNHIQAYWSSFIQTLDPNTKKASTAPEWTSWTGTNRVLFNLNGTTIETIDQDQLGRCSWLAQIAEDLKQ